MFVVLTLHAGWDGILEEIGKVRWNIFYIILIYAVVYLMDTLGWKFSFHHGRHKIGFGRLFCVRLAGEAVNATVPSANVGGEPVKAYLLKSRGIPMPVSLSSLIVAKTTLTLSEVFFVFLGLGLILLRLEISRPVQAGLVLMCLLFAAIIAVFMIYQRRGMFSGIAGLMMRLKIAAGFFDRTLHKIREMEEYLADYYRTSRKRFVLSVLFHFLGWIAGILEVYFILKFLHLPLTLADAFMIEALHQLVRGLAFFVPMNLGTQEGGSWYIFTLFGFGAVVGISVSLIRRVRELAWSLAGWIVLIFLGFPNRAQMQV